MKNTVTISIEEYDELRNFKKSILDGKHVVVNEIKGMLMWKEYAFYPPDELIDEFNNRLNKQKEEYSANIKSVIDDNNKLQEKNEQLLERIGELKSDLRYIIKIFQQLSIRKLIEQRRHIRKHPEKYAEL